MQPVDFLFVRKAQLLREIKALGLLYSLIVAGALLLLLTFFFKYQVAILNVAISGLLLAIIIVVIHFSRKDHRFIDLVAEVPFQIYMAEYAALVLPFALLSWIAFGQPLFFLVLIPVMLISLIRVKSKSNSNQGYSNRLISETNFEWHAGVRKTGGVLILIWLVALALTPIPFASIVALWFYLLTVSSFYDEGEPREMIEAYQVNSNIFIKAKLKSQIVSFLKPALPVLLISFLFFPDRWWVLLLFVVFCSVNIAVFVVTKYAVWSSGEVNRSGSIVNAMCMLGLFLPFFLPLPIVVLIKNYRKSLLNLNPLLHDYNH